jgi:hypothetical protein
MILRCAEELNSLPALHDSSSLQDGVQQKAEAQSGLKQRGAVLL